MWSQFQLWVSVKESKRVCWLVPRLLDNLASCPVGRHFPFWFWIFFIGEFIIAGSLGFYIAKSEQYGCYIVFAGISTDFNYPVKRSWNVANFEIKVTNYVYLVRKIFGNFLVYWKKFTKTEIMFLTDIDSLLPEIFCRKNWLVVQRFELCGIRLSANTTIALFLFEPIKFKF